MLGSWRPPGLSPSPCRVFREGLERGLRVAYLGSGNAGELREHLGRLADTGPENEAPSLGPRQFLVGITGHVHPPSGLCRSQAR
jgi:hypothetical protein